MPVVVTGASGFVGRHATAAFARSSPQVRAYVRRSESADALRALGAKVATGASDDVDNLAVVIHGAHTVCHLAGGLYLPDESAYVDANVRSLEAVLAAARVAQAKRILFLSYPGASPDAGNVYLRCKGIAEEMLASSGFEFLVLRATHVFGNGSPWIEAVRRHATSRPSIVVGSGRQRVAPVSVADVADVLVAADDRRAEVAGRWSVQGPEKLSADEVADLVAGPRRPRLHLPPVAARPAASVLGSGLSRTALVVMASDSLADAPDAMAEFGITPRSFRASVGTERDT